MNAERPETADRLTRMLTIRCPECGNYVGHGAAPHMPGCHIDATVRKMVEKRPDLYKKWHAKERDVTNG
jgi:hypothetical protein